MPGPTNGLSSKLTNDGWFGDNAVQWLHTVNAQIRTVELHLPLVRCCNNGITCWIDSCGRLHNVYFPESKNVYQAGYKLIEVPLAGPESGRHPLFTGNMVTSSDGDVSALLPLRDRKGYIFVELKSGECQKSCIQGI